MTLFEVEFKVSHDCPYCNISKKHPHLRMFDWCNQKHGVIEIITDKPDEQSAVTDEMSKIKGIVEESSDQQNAHFFRQKMLLHTRKLSINNT